MPVTILPPGKVTPVFARFSTVAGERGSKDTARDVRGFAVKFYTEEGNFDLVGNNIPVFFIQDAMKFPDLIHAAKPEQHNAMPQAFATTGNRDDGYTVGAGLEYMFAPNWSAKVEYQYYNFGNTTFATGPADIAGRSFRNDEHTAKVGVNYRFGWGGPAASRY